MIEVGARFALAAAGTVEFIGRTTELALLASGWSG
jgi:hypothetical protein